MLKKVFAGRPSIKPGVETGTKTKVGKYTHTVRKTRECVYVVFPVYVTAENLLRILPKGSQLKKNTNFMLASDLTSLDCSSQSRMTEHSLLELFPSSAIFSVLFSLFFFFPTFKSWSDSWQYISATESAGQLQQRGPNHACLFFGCCVVLQRATVEIFYPAY